MFTIHRLRSSHAHAQSCLNSKFTQLLLANYGLLPRSVSDRTARYFTRNLTHIASALAHCVYNAGPNWIRSGPIHPDVPRFTTSRRHSLPTRLDLERNDSAIGNDSTRRKTASDAARDRDASIDTAQRRARSDWTELRMRVGAEGVWARGIRHSAGAIRSGCVGGEDGRWARGIRHRTAPARLSTSAGPAARNSECDSAEAVSGAGGERAVAEVELEVGMGAEGRRGEGARHILE
ncbi:hypothetical protein C8R43DRAFT_477374 [Mycena crocata]|nr:hypothetical protein C8R43DRAFT_477374 [Mycena crocata]